MKVQIYYLNNFSDFSDTTQQTAGFRCYPQMKRFIFPAFMALIIFTACSKHNDIDPQISPKTATVIDLSGRWEVQNDTTFSIVNGKVKIDSILTPPFNKNSIATYLQFNADGSCSSDIHSLNYTYTLNAGTILVYSPYNGGTEKPDKWTILRISKKALLLQTNETATGYIHVSLSR